jgi:DNA-binding NtrC family response regulator
MRHGPNGIRANALGRQVTAGVHLASGVGMPAPTHTVLVVEDEQSIRDILEELFTVESNEVVAVGTLDDARRALATRVYDLIVTDLRLGGKRDGGLQVMAAAGILSPEAMVIVLTAYPDEDNRHASLRLGATHFLQKPVDLSTIAGLASPVGVATALTPWGVA